MSTSTSSPISIRALINEWRSSEAACTEIGQRAARWTAEFFAPRSNTFKVAYVQNEEFEEEVEPNATTSSVVQIIKEIESDCLVPPGFVGMGPLRNQVNNCLVTLSTFDEATLLPLRSFGPLPIFSVAYLARALSYCQDPFQNIAYAICMRRILFAIFQSQNQHWTQKAYPIHPYLLLHCTQALRRLEDLSDTARKAGEVPLLTAFAEMVADDEMVHRVFDTAGVERDKATEEVGCGIEGFKNYIGTVAVKQGPEGAIGNALLFIEGLAISQALEELAKHRGHQSRLTDASILAFALNTLSVLDVVRHMSLLAQGVVALTETCHHGYFQPGRPFYIDRQGRALTVPSVEISNALLTIALARVEIAQTTELQAILQTTKDVESALFEEKRKIQILKNGEATNMEGWCSDRAPARDRVDAWVTGNALLFFLQRLNLLAAAKRRHVLGQYSWIPYGRCKPKWKDIVDPNEGSAKGLKPIVEEAIRLPEAFERMQAPVFLLYGPPGTSKTTLVYGIASLNNWDLVTLSPSDFIADSLDRIEVRAREIFEDLESLNKCVILLDEMDALFRDREILKDKGAGTIMEFVVPALLPKLQHLRDYTLDKQIAVFFVSNYYETIDPAIRRNGRIDFHLEVLPYRKEARSEVVRRLVKKDFPTIGSAKLNALLEYIQKQPCNLVYRDLQRLVQAADRATDIDIVKQLELINSGLGISPEIYSPNRRQNAYGEVCSVVARFLDSDSPPRDTYVKRNAARDFLTEKTEDIKPFTDWSTLVKAWVQHLTAELKDRKDEHSV